VEAKLITAKRAGDAVYVATLAEELRRIEEKIAEMENAQQLVWQWADAPPEEKACPQDDPDANWIRRKSIELDQRLHRIERSAKEQ